MPNGIGFFAIDQNGRAYLRMLIGLSRLSVTL
jgi:hypothetical protein